MFKFSRPGSLRKPSRNSVTGEKAKRMLSILLSVMMRGVEGRKATFSLQISAAAAALNINIVIQTGFLLLLGRLFNELQDRKSNFLA